MNAAPVFLLVEPSSILQSVLRTWLQYKFANAHVLIAENGVEALRLAAQETPTQVLVEINLPDKTGFELLHQLRHSLPTARIVVTGWYDHSFYYDRIKSTGADGYVVWEKLPSELLPLWEISIE
jgi:DNA-binding NarL/FixJ family response regulator